MMASIEETYIRSITSSHLRSTELPGDVDTLIAAGLSQSGLGWALYRVRAEFDRAACELKRAKARNAAGEAAVLIEAASVSVGPTLEQAIRAEVAHEAITDRLMILVGLSSLARARDELGIVADRLANRLAYMHSPANVALLTGRVLDAWLDPLCPHCAGRGFNGGSHRGEFQIECRPCSGFGLRRGWVGRNDAERAFADALLIEMQRALAEFAGQIRRRLGTA